MGTGKETTHTVRYIFISSPGDLSAERKRFPKVLEKLNRIKAHKMGEDVRLLGWEDALPGRGRPQSLINANVEKCNLFVMLLWKRWGTPPGGGSLCTSGTEEEYELASKLGKDILLYFRDVREDMLADPGADLRRVLDFRKKIEAEKALFFARYSTLADWEDQVMEHIARWLDGFQPSPSPTSVPIPPDPQQRIAQLEEELSKLVEEHKDAQTKLREVAADLGNRAVRAGQHGRLTEAEELFARAIQTYPEPWVINAFGVFYKQVGSLTGAKKISPA